MSSVLLLKGGSQYNALRNYIDEIEQGFRLAGYDTCIIDGKDKSAEFQLRELVSSTKIDIIFACNALFIEEVKELCPNAWYMAYMTDRPTGHRERLERLDERAIVFTCDRRHEAYIRKYFPNIKNVKYIPLSGQVYKRHNPYQERTKDIVFTGSYCKPEHIYTNHFSCSEDLKEIEEYMVASIIKNPKQDLEMCLNNYLSQFDMTVSNREFHEMLCRLDWIDLYARFYYRDKIIRELVTNGLKVHVFGSGWEAFDGEGKENLIIEKGNYYVAGKAVANAKISINTMPWFKDGFQERIVAAMLSGTVAVTDESSYICENFKDGAEMVLYSLEHLEELPVKVKWLLDHPKEAENIAKTGMERAEKALTWQHRVFEMLPYIQECTSLFPAQKGQYGQILQIPYQTLHNRDMSIDAVNHMYEILDMTSQVKSYDKIEKCDVDYFYMMFLYQYTQISANFPETQISNVVYDFIMNVTDEQAETAMELLNLECMHILAVFLGMENQKLVKEITMSNSQLTSMKTVPNQHSWQILIKKLKSNYGKSQDVDIQEILGNIELHQSVSPYNQNFVYKYQKSPEAKRKLVQYDTEAGMYYALLDGKKMYYPKDYSKEMAATAFNFTCLEQDPKSPHRYKDDSFDVQEGDIVVDAGVAEGNFALEAVEKAKKIYLVECEHKWVEALRKTFEPWKEKVVIIEKMLSDTDDDLYASIDSFVEEGYINFLKLDVEGAEISSLKGASKVLDNSKNIRCAICAYHCKNAEKDIRKILEEHRFYTSTTKGYMFFKEDMDSWVDGELRHGIVRAVKGC